MPPARAYANPARATRSAVPPPTGIRQDARMDIGMTEAAAAFIGQHDLPQGHNVVAHRLPNRMLWSVSVSDETGSPYVGAVNLVGPDGRLWTLSSNPGIHDFGPAVDLLDRAYREGLTDQLDDDQFVSHVREVTESREAQTRQFIADLRSGSLRTPKPRRLP
jgi:hypothetical protein